jgi:hypothetical protein
MENKKVQPNKPKQKKHGWKEQKTKSNINGNGRKKEKNKNQNQKSRMDGLIRTYIYYFSISIFI